MSPKAFDFTQVPEQNSVRLSTRYTDSEFEPPSREHDGHQPKVQDDQQGSRTRERAVPVKGIGTQQEWKRVLIALWRCP